MKCIIYNRKGENVFEYLSSNSSMYIQSLGDDYDYEESVISYDNKEETISKIYKDDELICVISSGRYIRYIKEGYEFNFEENTLSFDNMRKIINMIDEI